MKTNFTFLLTIICVFSLKAQLPVVVDLDLKSNAQLSSLPFDRPVILKMKPPGNYIYGVGLIELRGGMKRKFNKSLPSLSDNSSFKFFLDSWLQEKNYFQVPEIPEKNFVYKYFESRENEQEKTKKDFFLRIEGITVYPRKYHNESRNELTVKAKDYINELDDYNEERKDIKLAYSKEKNFFGKNIIENKIRSDKSITNAYYLHPNSKYILLIRKEAKIKIEDYEDKIKRGRVISALKPSERGNLNSLFELYDKLQENIKKYQDSTSYPNEYNTIIEDDFRKDLKRIILLHAKDIKTAEYSSRINKIFRDTAFVIIINRILSFKNKNIIEIIQGKDLLRSYNYFPEKLEESDLLTNVSKNYNDFENLKFIVDYFSSIENLDNCKTKIELFHSFLKKNFNDREQVFRLKEIISNIILSNKLAEESEKPIILTSDIYDFETRSKLAITPEFGFIGAGLNRGIVNNERLPDDPKKIFSPYLGFHINFRYWDKSLPFWSNPNHKFINHWSVMFGYTLNKIDSKTNTDFFSNGRSLLLGAGFRLGNVARIVSGLMLSNQVNSTKKAPSSPYEIVKYDEINKTENGVTIKTITTSSVPTTSSTTIDSRVVKPTFYLGISFDLSLKPFFGTDFSDLNPVKWFRNSSNGTPR